MLDVLVRKWLCHAAVSGGGSARGRGARARAWRRPVEDRNQRRQATRRRDLLVNKTRDSGGRKAGKLGGAIMATTEMNVGDRSRPMTAEERKVIVASSAGTIFEWYDFYLYGSLGLYIGFAFFNSYPEGTRTIFVLLAFAAGFLVRPFGALVFGRLGDLVGRKYTFLVTILIMGASTFLVGLLPGSATLGIA
eukprot:gene1666-1942_t